MIRLKVIDWWDHITEQPNTWNDVTFTLDQAVPNPMHKKTSIEFQIPIAQNVSIRIYDATGQLVKTLINAQKEAGIHNVIWDGLDENNRPVANGVYFYRLQGKTDDITRKLVITR